MRLLAAAALLLASLAAAEAQIVRPGSTGMLEALWPETDFSRAAIDLDEVTRGGPPRDGIPALTDPAFVPLDEKTGLDPREPVVSLTLEGETRAYPIRYLTWHEIANDRIGGVPVAVTYCPLCNTAVVFDRRVGGETLEFGVSGLLRHSDMIMYDRTHFTWWQQFTGEAIVGALTGAELRALPSRMESWANFRARAPEGAVVMAEPEGWSRDYGRNPYVGYDGLDWPFLYRGERPPHGIAPLARVVRVGARAWPMTRVAEAGRIAEAGVVIDWTEGQASALDAADLAGGAHVGDIAVRDAETGAPVVHEVTFAFAFHAFHPEGAWMLD